METKFQTSFIPRKPLISSNSSPQTPAHGGPSIVILIAIVIFGASVVGAVVVVGWQKVAERQIENNKIQLETNRKQFGSDIEFLKRFNTKINLVKSLVDNHLAISKIFSIIGDATVDNVRFKSFDFILPSDNTKNITVTMKGEAKNFDTLAYQTDVLGQGKSIKNPIVSDLSLADTGIVSFAFTGSIAAADVLYSKKFLPNTPATRTSSTTPSDIKTPNQ